MTHAPLNNTSRASSRIAYLEYLRVFAMFAVVLLHTASTCTVIDTAPAASSVQGLILHCCRAVCEWAVPVFIMISGTLLLDGARPLPGCKLWQYIRKMLLVLVVFGIPYAMMELVSTEKAFSLSTVLRAALLTAEYKTWDHMWYVYFLIGLYLLTPLFRAFTAHSSLKQVEAFLAVLAVGQYGIPLVNALLGLSLHNFMYLPPMLTYYLLGFYLARTKRTFRRISLVLLPVSLVSVAVLEIAAQTQKLTYYQPLHDLLVLLLSASVFLTARYALEQKPRSAGKVCTFLSQSSFAVYLIHAFYINLFYKALHVSPNTLPLWLGIPVMFALITACSLGTAVIVRRLPGLRKLL